jgi:hypothetical protein
LSNGVPISGATSSNYTINATATNMSGSGFSVVVSNVLNAQTSRVARLTVFSDSRVTLVSLTNTVWAYDQSGGNPSVCWNDPDYDDAAWQMGRGVLAWENNSFVNPLTNAVLSLTNPVGQGIMTYYFRTAFSVADPAEFASLTFTNLIDDGCVVYLNGTELYRLNLASGPITYSSATPAAATEGAFITTNVPAGGLRAGTNVLAVEVHQNNTNSSDVVFGLALAAVSAAVSPAVFVEQPEDVATYVGNNATFTATVRGMTPITYQWYFDRTNLLVDETNSFLVLENVQTSAAGSYAVVVSNLFGTRTSTPAGLILRDAPLPPVGYADFPADLQVILAQRLAAIQTNGFGCVAGRIILSDGTSISGGTDASANLLFSGDRPLQVFSGGWFIRTSGFGYGRDTIAIRAFGYQPIDTSITILSNQITYFTFLLVKTPRQDRSAISGIVLDENSQPFAGAQVLLSFPFAYGAGGRPTQTTWTGWDGRYRFTGLSQATHQATASASSYAKEWHVVAPPSGGTVSSDFQLFPNRQIAIDYVLQTNGTRDFTDGSLPVRTIPWLNGAGGLDFSLGSIVTSSGRDLDLQQDRDVLQFRNFYVSNNGFYDAGTVDFDSITSAASTGYSVTAQPCLVGHVYVVRTYDGFYAKFIVKSDEESFRTVAAGNPPPIVFAGHGLTLDFADCSGSSQVYVSEHLQPPHGTGITTLPYQWEITLSGISFSASLSLHYPEADLQTVGIGECSLSLLSSTDGGAHWTVLPFQQDAVNNTVRVEGLKSFNPPVLFALGGSPGDGLMAAYSFEGNTLDNTCHHNDGVPQGITFISDGVSGQAAHFDGTAHIRVPRSESLDLTNGMTIACWIRAEDLAGWVEPVDKGIDFDGYELMTADGTLFVRFGNATVFQGSVPLGRWVHLAGVYTGSETRAYVNGVRVGQGPAGLLHAMDKDLYLGCWADRAGNTSRHLRGALDEVRIYNRSLTDVEMRTLFASHANAALFGQNLGDPGVTGSLVQTNGLFTVCGAGEGIEGAVDDFFFSSVPWTGDGQMQVRLVSIVGGDPRAEAGVMMRDGLQRSAPHVFLAGTRQSRVVFRRRLTDGESSLENAVSNRPPVWLRLSRMGETFIGHHSTNGSQWNLVWFTTVPMSNTVQVGLALTSHHYGQLATATMDQASISALTPLSGVWPFAGPRVYLGGEPGGATSHVDAGFTVLFGGNVGDVYQVQASDNLPDFVPLQALTNTYGTAVFIDPSATNRQQRFYRLRVLSP